MIRNKKRLCLAFLCFCFGILAGNGNYVRAEEYSEKQITGMDETGNVYEIEMENDAEEEVSFQNLAYDGEISICNLNESGRVVNFNTKGSVVTNYYENTTQISGYTCGAYAADAAYLGEYDGKVKFMLGGVVGWVEASEVQVLDISSVSSVSYYTVSGGRLIHKISTNVTGNGYWSSLDNGPAPSYLAEGMKYYSYDGHYFYPEGQWHIMQDDYYYGTRSRAINADSPFYNYFQFLPLRSYTSYSASELNEMINSKISSSSSKMWDIGETMVKQQNNYGVNALIMAGIAANESAWGTSSIANNKNNLFGLNAVDSSPGESANYFSSPEQCVKEFAEIWMSKGYLYPKDWRYYGGFLGNKASGINVMYASDPYWGEKAAAVAWTLDKAGNNQDQYQYTIGIKGTVGQSNPHINVNIRAKSNVDSTILYQSGKQRESAVLILNSSQENGFYKIQSDGVLKSDRSGVTKETGKYDFDSMYAYISAEYVNIVSKGEEGFKDVRGGEWYYDSVMYVYERGIMTGLNSRLFGVDQELARAQFSVVLYRMMGQPQVSYTGNFPDVPQGIWYADAVGWANNVGIVTGYESTGYFGSGDSINREQIATMMYRYAKVKGYNTGARVDISAYPDASDVNEFAKDAMEWAVANRIIQGDNGYLKPQGVANRAECATIIRRFMETLGS